MTTISFFCDPNKQASSQYLGKDGSVAIFRRGFCKIENNETLAKEVEEIIASGKVGWYKPDQEEIDAMLKAEKFGVSAENGKVLGIIEQELRKQIMAELGVKPEGGEVQQAQQFNTGVGTALGAISALDPNYAHNAKVDLESEVSKLNETGNEPAKGNGLTVTPKK